jgi:hypothetical protein
VPAWFRANVRESQSFHLPFEILTSTPLSRWGSFILHVACLLSSGASNLDVNYISAEEDETSHVIPLVILQTHIQFSHTVSTITLRLGMYSTMGLEVLQLLSCT